MSGLIFNEESMINGNIFKFEKRLKTHLNKYVENGAILTTYYCQNENATTVDRGTRDIEQVFGHMSPIRYNRINNLPLYGFGQANPENSDEMQIEDINVDGECLIAPATIVPKPMDFFIVNHLKMRAIFQVVNVQFDSMKVEGYYKIRYHLFSTSEETLLNLEKQTIGRYTTDLNAVGSDVNPVIEDEDFTYRSQVIQMMNQMIQSYRALFYNERHNCFLYHDRQSGLDWFDLCGNEFIGKHGLMNPSNSSKIIVTQDKIRDIQMPFYYNNSVYNWLELGAPARLLQRFHYSLVYADGYPTSSFAMWGEGDVQVMQPLALQHIGPNNQDHAVFDVDQMNALMNPKIMPSNEHELLLWKYIHNEQNLTIHDVSLYTGDVLISSVKHLDTFLYSPMVIFIIRAILGMN